MWERWIGISRLEEEGEEEGDWFSGSGSKLCRYRTYIYPAKYGLILIVTVTMGFFLSL